MSRKFTRLTRDKMRLLNPGGSIFEHGIKFTRDMRGDGVFSVNIMIDKRRIHRVIGRESDGVTRTQAEDFISHARTDARRGRLDLPVGRKTPLGFREAAAQYLQRLEPEDGRNLKAKRRQFQQHLVPFFADNPLSNISQL